MSLKIMITITLRLMNLDEALLDEFIDCASNGQEAVDMFDQVSQTKRRYILIFMDCSMPFKDGYSATTEIR